MSRVSRFSTANVRHCNRRAKVQVVVNTEGSPAAIERWLFGVVECVAWCHPVDTGEPTCRQQQRARIEQSTAPVISRHWRVLARGGIGSPDALKEMDGGENEMP